MKKLTTIIVLIAGILIVSICNFNTVREAFELNTRNAAVDSKVINKENKYIKSELKIPKLVMNNKEIERILNKKFESDITLRLRRQSLISMIFQMQKINLL